jgi:hypothetical protein
VYCSAWAFDLSPAGATGVHCVSMWCDFVYGGVIEGGGDTD